MGPRLVGDITELKAVGEVFSDYKPKISSTKSLAGHSHWSNICT